MLKFTKIIKYIYDKTLSKKVDLQTLNIELIKIQEFFNIQFIQF